MLALLADITGVAGESFASSIYLHLWHMPLQAYSGPSQAPKAT
jgi:hypothetical protein